jgi:signal transduction histidine kinase
VTGQRRQPPVDETQVLVSQPRRLPPRQEEAPAAPPAAPPAALPEDYLERCLVELVRYYRHSSAGRLVTGIVHQMNTPLQVLSFQLELLEVKAENEAEILPGCPPATAEKLAALHDYRREKIRQFRAELEKLQGLVRRLILQGEHEEARDRRRLDLNQLVTELLDHYLAQPFFRHRVNREIRLQPGLPAVWGHYLDFSQSFRNLLDNALEAMEDSASRVLTVTTAPKGGCGVLTLGDTGVGIPAATLPLVFEPFFTTKPGHAGLGLFMVRRLLAPYGAQVRVESAPGATRVTVSLPA